MKTVFNIGYFGTPDFSARFLETIFTDKTLPVKVVYVFTQGDKPVGRKKIITSSPVKLYAQKHHISIYENIYTINRSQLAAVDLCVVYAYGKIIPAEFLNTPRYGFWNIHPSLLPHYRGPSPIAYPLLLGDTETGVTLVQMDEKIDHGPIIAQEKISVAQVDNKSDLEIKLTDKGCQLFIKIIVQFISTKCMNLHPKTQNHTYATYTHLLTKDHGFMALEIIKKALSCERIIENKLPSLIKEYFSRYPHKKINFLKRTFNFSFLTFNLFRALHPWPGLWTKVIINNQEKKLQLTNLSFENNELHINKVQLEGKKEVDFIQFNTAYQIFEKTKP